MRIIGTVTIRGNQVKYYVEYIYLVALCEGKGWEIIFEMEHL